MAPDPTAPILIPRAPTSPLDPSLRTSLQHALLAPKTIRALRNTLDAETAADAWREKVRRRTLQLLGSREEWEWEDLVAVVVREARGVEGGEGGGEEEQGLGGKGKGGGGGGDVEGTEKVDIRIPEKAVTAASKVVKGALEKKVELEPEGKGFWD